MLMASLRFAGVLLHCYYYVDIPEKRVQCIQSIYNIYAANEASAVKKLNRIGFSHTASYYVSKSGHGLKLKYEGIVELLELGSEADENEVYYSVRQLQNPEAHCKVWKASSKKVTPKKLTPKKLK